MRVSQKTLTVNWRVFFSLAVCFGSIGFAQETENEILKSPTADFEKYQETKEKLYAKTRIPKTAYFLTVAPNAFHSTDFRVPRPHPQSSLFSTESPTLIGVIIGAERFLLRKYGLFSLGGGLGLYGTEHVGKFDGDLPIYMYSLLALAHYQMIYFHKQWFVPSFKAAVEGFRYDYYFYGNRVAGFGHIYRFDLGMMFLLNILEPKAVANARASFGVNRMYLSGYYSTTIDPKYRPLDLTERAGRIEFRIEF